VSDFKAIVFQRLSLVKWSIFFFLTQLLVFSGFSWAASDEKTEILWLVWDQPPNYFATGKYKGKGIAGRLNKTLHDRMPEYLHIDITSNAKRYDQLIADTKRVSCSAWAWKIRGNNKFRYFSNPHSLIPPIGIYIHKSNQEKLGPKGSVLSLLKLL